MFPLLLPSPAPRRPLSSSFPPDLLMELTKIFVRFPFVNLPLDLQFEKYMTTTILGRKRKKKIGAEAAAREADRVAAEKAAARAERDKQRK